MNLFLGDYLKMNYDEYFLPTLLVVMGYSISVAVILAYLFQLLR